ncbi:MAG: 4Fe-4S binding protein [Deltaproteobacteria bacterium]|nr:4Fe-4S binding protein [Deltaproteobacteria bacterium]
MPDSTDLYRRLRAHLDEMPVPFPATESGVELRLLARLYSPEEAEAALLLSAVPEPAARIAARAPGADPAALAVRLDAMAEKGLLLRSGRPDRRRYGKAPLAVGIYEMQVDRLTREVQDDFEAYGQEAFKGAFLGGRTGQMRTVPVNATFVPERAVGRYDDARALLAASPGPFAIQNCVCRQGRDLQAHPCSVTSERRVCLGIGHVAKSLVRSGHGQPVERDEVMRLLDTAEQDGLVLQPSNTRDPVFMCFCCGCCCGVLRMAKALPRPAEAVTTNYRAAVDGSSCAGCGACVPRCPMDALDDSGDATAVLADRCIGCGVCVPACPTGALSLAVKPRPAVPPRSLGTLYGRLTVERFGWLGTARRLGKALLGRRV